MARKIHRDFFVDSERMANMLYDDMQADNTNILELGEKINRILNDELPGSKFTDRNVIIKTKQIYTVTSDLELILGIIERLREHTISAMNKATESANLINLMYPEVYDETLQEFIAKEKYQHERNYFRGLGLVDEDDTNIDDADLYGGRFELE